MAEFDGTVVDSGAEAEQATYYSIAGNVALTIVKLAVGWTSGSAALVADGYHSGSDVISSVIVLVGLDLARRPADDEHPYGHGKVEVLAAKLVATILIAIGAWAVYGGVTAIRGHLEHVVPGRLAAAAAFLSIVVKEGLYQYKARVARRTGSQALMADAWHHRSDAFSSVVSLLAIGGAILGGTSWGFLDHLGAVVIGVIIAWTGAALYVESSRELLDAVVVGRPLQIVRECASSVDGVRVVEKAYVRKAGLDLLVDLHIHVDPDITVREGHGIGHRVKACIMAAMPAVKSLLVHVEPCEGCAGCEGCRAGVAGQEPTT